MAVILDWIGSEGFSEPGNTAETHYSNYSPV
jgi:hypothetical protein